jgi:tripartite-type tricarboxylate transporter receptor subunit TctC
MLASCAAFPVAAFAYPERPVTIVVPFAPGGANDVVVRAIQQPLAEALGQPIVIENRGGAGGSVGAGYVARARPDGYTLLMAATGFVVNPSLYDKVQYDPLADFEQVAEIATFPVIYTVRPDMGVNTLQEFIAYAKAQPDKVSYASAGVGTTPDLAAHEFNQRAGLKLVFVPFRGTAPAVAAVLGGDVQVTFVSMGPHIEFVRQGKLRILGAATPKRAPYLPDVPTFAEQGFPGFETSTWFSLFAPRGTPNDIVEQLNGYVRALGRDPDARKRLEANFIDPADMTASEFGDLVKADAVKWERIVRDAGVKID